MCGCNTLYPGYFCARHNEDMNRLRSLLTEPSPFAHEVGYGEVTFVRTDGRKVVVDNVNIDSISGDARGIVGMEVSGAEETKYLPFIESWTVAYRF